MKVSQHSTGAICSTPQQNLPFLSSPPVRWKKRDGTLNQQETKIPVQLNKAMLQALDSCKAMLRKRISVEEASVICIKQEAK